MARKPEPKPTFEHNCTNCRFLGKMPFSTADVYICDDNLVVRYSNLPRDYSALSLLIISQELAKGNTESYGWFADDRYYCLLCGNSDLGNIYNSPITRDDKEVATCHKCGNSLAEVRQSIKDR